MLEEDWNPFETTCRVAWTTAKDPWIDQFNDNVLQFESFTEFFSIHEDNTLEMVLELQTDYEKNMDNIREIQQCMAYRREELSLCKDYLSTQYEEDFIAGLNKYCARYHNALEELNSLMYRLGWDALEFDPPTHEDLFSNEGRDDIMTGIVLKCSIQDLQSILQLQYI